MATKFYSDHASSSFRMYLLNLESEKAWDDVNNVLETFDDASWSDYLIAPAIVGGATHTKLSWTVPSVLPAGKYVASIYTGTTPLVTDVTVETREISWDGTNIVSNLDAVAGNWFVDTVNGDDSNSGLNKTVAFATVGKAIAVATQYDTINILAGTYTEQLTISTNNVMLRGESTADTVITFASGNTLTITSENVTLENLTVKGTASVTFTDTAIYARNTEDLTLINVRIDGEYLALDLFGAKRPFLKRCKLVGQRVGLDASHVNLGRFEECDIETFDNFVDSSSNQVDIFAVKLDDTASISGQLTSCFFKNCYILAFKSGTTGFNVTGVQCKGPVVFENCMIYAVNVDNDSTTVYTIYDGSGGYPNIELFNCRLHSQTGLSGTGSVLDIRLDATNGVCRLFNTTYDDTKANASNNTVIYETSKKFDAAITTRATAADVTRNLSRVELSVAPVAVIDRSIATVLRVKARFYDSLGSLVNPTSPIITLSDPDGGALPAVSSFTNVSTGVEVADITIATTQDKQQRIVIDVTATVSTSPVHSVASVQFAEDNDLADISSNVNTAVEAGQIGIDTAAILLDTGTDGVKLNATQPSSWADKLTTSAGTMVKGVVDSAAFTSTVTEFETNLTETTPDHYNGRVIIFTSGALVDQAATILDYASAGGRGHFTVSVLTEIPANTDAFIII